MIQFLRRHAINSMKNVFVPKKTISLRSQTGQIGIVLILLAAFGLLFYAVVLNFSKASDLKTRTLIAAEASAALTASYLAGTAEKLSQEHLKGEAGYCDSSSWLEAVFKIILLVIVIIIAIIINIIPGVGSLISALLWAVVIGAILAIVFTTISIILQITVVQPGITSMWNEMMAKSFENFEDQVLEQGIQMSLQKIVDDTVELPDVLDFDNDGVYAVVNGAVISGGIPDTYARFAHYNTLRLQGAVANRFDPSYLDEFVARLRGLLFLNDTDKGTVEGRVWGFFDETLMFSGGVCPNGASACDPCCLPVPAICCGSCAGEFDRCEPLCCATATCATPAEINRCGMLEPPCCDIPECAPGGIAAATCGYPRPLTCGSEYPDKCYYHSFLYEDNTGNESNPADVAFGQPFIYDPYFEDARNNTDSKYISFREWLGRDDVSDAFKVTVDEATPAYPVKWNTLETLPDDRQEVDPVSGGTVAAALTANFVNPLEERFRPQDASGFYNQDDQAGQFPLFYKIRDQIELPMLGLVAQPNSLNCMWWNRTDSPCTEGILPDPDEQFVLPYLLGANVEYGGVVVLADTLAPLLYEDYAGGNVFRDMGFYGGPDKVGTIGLERLFADDTICAEVAARPVLGLFVGETPAQSIQSNANFPGFKPGTDFYCSENYPYDAHCRKNDPAGGCVEVRTFQRIVDGVTPIQWETYSQSFPVDCSCGETATAHPTKWPDDILDSFYRKITELVALTNELNSLQARKLLTTTFADWYDNVADWIEPAYNKAACEAAANPATDRSCLETYTKKERWGHLWVFREDFREIFQILESWLNNVEDITDAVPVPISYQGGSCGEAWCLPDPDCVMLKHSSGVGQTKEALGYDTPVKDGVYDANDDGLDAVIQCMEWAETAQVESLTVPGTYLPDVGVQGYYIACLNHCGTAYCDNLPRPFVPDYKVITTRPIDADWRMPLAAVDMGGYQKCLSSITVDQCMAATPGDTTECADTPGFANYDPPDVEYTDIIGQWTPCLGLPVVATACDGGTPWASLLITCATPREDIDLCMRNRLNSCGWIVPGGDTSFYDAMILSTDCSPGIAGVVPESPYRRWLKANIAVADPLVVVAKLAMRKKFLIAVRDEIEEARNGFREAYNRLTEFLDNGTVFGTAMTFNQPSNPNPCEADMEAQIVLPGTPTGYADTAAPAVPSPYRRLDSLCDTVPCKIRFPYSNRTEVHGGTSFTGTNQDSPSEMLIRVRTMQQQAADVDYQDSGLPAFAIYVWRGDAETDPDWMANGVMHGEGLLHAVKVDARVPRRCRGRCDFYGQGPMEWPKIETFTTGFLGSTRCYELRNYFGMTKARVIRFDQSPNISKLKLFNKIPFVLPNLSHPDVGTGQNITGGNVFRVGGTPGICEQYVDPLIIQPGICEQYVDPLIIQLIANNVPPTVDPDFQSIQQAFMINWPPTGLGQPWGSLTAAQQADLTCWNFVHENILRYGVVSHSCANYYWGGPGGAGYGQQGMRVKFAPCNQTFIESGDLDVH